MGTSSRLFGIAGVVAVLSLAGAAPASTVFTDGIFNNADWSLTTITNPAGAGSTVGANQIATGGNPNQYRIVFHTLQITAPNSLVVGVHMNALSFYNPSTQGAISTINYSEDSINLINQGGGGQATGLAIIQGGNIYVQRNPILTMPFSGFSTWTANPAPGLVASDLYLIDNAGNFFAGSNPDFSASGGPMQFGFYRGNSSGNVSSGSFITEAGIDNWRVEIVPAPGVAGLMGLGALVATRRRRA
jgi:hypothetical protein